MLRYIFRYRWLTFSFIFLLVLAALFCVWTLYDLASFKERMSNNDDVILQEGMSQKAHNNVRGDVQRTKLNDSIENQSESVEDTSVPTEETTPTTDTAMRLFCLTITGERGTIFASPIIVIYNCITVRNLNSLLII